MKKLPETSLKDSEPKGIYTPDDFQRLGNELEKMGLASRGVTVKDVIRYCGLSRRGEDPVKELESRDAYRDAMEFNRRSQGSSLPKVSATGLNKSLLSFREIRENAAFTTFLIEQSWLEPKVGE